MPFLSRAVRGIARRLRREPRKLYPSWDAAKAAAVGYDDGLLTRFRVARAKNYAPSQTRARETLMPLALDLLGLRDAIITDYGGSLGEAGLSLLLEYPAVQYIVVEQEALAGLDSEPIKFTSTIPDDCDVFYSSGTLQCVDDPLGSLDAGFRSAQRAVVLVRNCFCDRQLYRVQRSMLFENGSGAIPAGFNNAPITYAHRTIRQSDVFDIAERHGFRCAASLDEVNGVYPYRLEVYGRQLLFLRD